MTDEYSVHTEGQLIEWACNETGGFLGCGGYLKEGIRHLAYLAIRGPADLGEMRDALVPEGCLCVVHKFHLTAEIAWKHREGVSTFRLPRVKPPTAPDLRLSQEQSKVLIQWAREEERLREAKERAERNRRPKPTTNHRNQYNLDM